MNGGGVSRLSIEVHSISLKKGWSIISLTPAFPRRCDGFKQFFVFCYVQLKQRSHEICCLLGEVVRRLDWLRESILNPDYKGVRLHLLLVLAVEGRCSTQHLEDEDAQTVPIDTMIVPFA